MTDFSKFLTSRPSKSLNQILLVEDNPRDIELWIEALADAGLTIEQLEVTTDGKRALDSLKHAAQRGCLPRLVITDAMMPGMSGPDLAKKIAGNEAIKHIPVAIVSSSLPVEMITYSPMQIWYEKPPTFEKLCELANLLIKKHVTALNPSKTSASTNDPHVITTSPQGFGMAALVWNVLLIDDNPDYLYIFEQAVREQHLPINILPVQSALDAMNLLSKQGTFLGRPTPDLIISDLNMPKVSGLQLLQLLKKSSWREIPVIIHSTTSRLNEQSSALSLGAVEFWTKPGNLDQLIAELPRIMKYLGNGNVEGASGNDGA